MLSGIVLVWLYSLYSSYRQAVHEVEEWDETRIEQVARALLVLDVRDLSAFAGASLTPRDDDGDNDTAMLLYEVTAADGRALAASPGLSLLGLPARPAHASGLLRADDAKWRIYVLGDAARGRTVRIFEPRTHRSEFSTMVAQRIARPLAIALPVLAILVWLAIGSSLTPLRTLSEAIEARSPDSLDAVSLKSVPDEVFPLVAALNTLLQRLRQSLDRERAFTGDAAHELKTPLAAIKVQAQVALTASDPERQRRAMQRVVEAVDRSTHLADQLLALARLEESTPLPGARVDLADMAKACIVDQHAQADHKQMSLMLRADGATTLCAPPTLVRILLDNLVDNAIKYGRAQGHIEIAIWSDADTRFLEVRDDGPGVAEADLSRLQNRFFRGANHVEKGSGLGLSIVARIVAQLRGRIEYTTGIDGRGFGVRVGLPLPMR
ncbi:two-component sensor histidine kinase [Paraburkholderia sp. Tr-20389]|uniref:ATP-binding protein n=1 Tax=Paraburkholderia sp. Tr-20389 TaxID=2703903 RepID=UPI00197D43A4|nr:ATP-binding protein [Paraburkholderia sp. Tr-20389]MBN3751599.1 two-component sensor histidine kinase [Paraburkholderia sp. Tr-20389]